MNNLILDKLKWRYATKKFDATKKLPEEKINLLKEVFNLTATSYGLQPLKLVVISNSEIKNKLVEASMNQTQVKDASHVFVICIENKLDAQDIETYFNTVKQIRGTSDSILNPFKEYLIQSFAEKTPEEIRSWMKNQAYIALGKLLTACALESIDACPMEGFVPEAYDKILELSQKGISPVLVLPVGYRAEDDFFADLKKVRKGVSNVVIDIN